MNNIELIDKIYAKWLDYGYKIKKAFKDNEYALENIQLSIDDSKEEYSFLADNFGKKLDSKKYNIINEKLKDILNKINGQYELAESLAEYNNTFAEDILFDVWIDYMSKITDSLNNLLVSKASSKYI